MRCPLFAVASALLVPAAATAQFRPVPPVNGMAPHATGTAPPSQAPPPREPPPSQAPPPRARPPTKARATHAPPPLPSVERVTFDREPANAVPQAFVTVVGELRVGDVAHARGAIFDGSHFVPGTRANLFADKARALFAADSPRFVAGVGDHAKFPLAILRNDCAGASEIAIRFYPIGGRAAQSAGIAFAIAPDGSYLVARASGRTADLRLLRVEAGVATLVARAGEAAAAAGRFHTLTLRLDGRDVAVTLDGRARLKHRFDHPPVGRCGLWSEADSEVMFDNFVLTRSALSGPR
jgi:hypothetical protein